jgi:serine/threonine-protein kinase PRP4
MQPAQTKRLPEDDLRLLQSFVDLLNRSLELDPSKRITPKEALMVRCNASRQTKRSDRPTQHPFLR